jgi:adenylate cyclase
MRDFFAQLKRRHVYRVAIYYAAAAWLLVQIADLVLENFNLPDRVMQLLIVGAAMGFPLALVLAWFFDISSSGIRRTAPVSDLAAGDDSPVPDPAIVATKAEERPGIVVLPFDSFSEQPRDEIVSNGFTEDLTTLLARMPGFFVISRNTAYMYKGQRRDLREICSELGVRYLLEGSLRRVGDQVRVTAQLIEAETGSHLWADNYDAPLDDMERVQDELINGIATTLGVELARAEFKLARRQRPGDMNAWSLYQSAKGTLMFMGWSHASIKQAVSQLHEAIALDPEYAAPQAYLSLLLALAHWIKLVDDLPAAHDESVSSANRALELDPNSSEVLGFVGCAFSDLGYKARGIPILEKAMELDRSNAQARAAFGAALMVSGELEPGIAALSDAIKISPRDPGIAVWATILALGVGYTGDLAKAEEWTELAYKSDPRFFPCLVLRAWLQGKKGQKDVAQASLDEARRLYPDLDADYVSGFMGQGVAAQMREAGLTFDDTKGA